MNNRAQICNKIPAFHIFQRMQKSFSEACISFKWQLFFLSPYSQDLAHIVFLYRSRLHRRPCWCRCAHLGRLGKLYGSTVDPCLHRGHVCIQNQLSACQIRCSLLASWVKFPADNILQYFSYFSLKIGYDISCKLTICMKLRRQFAWNVKSKFSKKKKKKNKKNVINQSSAEFAHRAVSVILQVTVFLLICSSLDNRGLVWNFMIFFFFFYRFSIFITNILTLTPCPKTSTAPF